MNSCLREQNDAGVGLETVRQGALNNKRFERNRGFEHRVPDISFFSEIQLLRPAKHIRTAK
jgi:hypothetical protein